MHRLPLLAALLSPVPAIASSAPCTLPALLDGRQFINLSDPLYHPGNPNAGRMVQVNFSGDRYLLQVLGTPLAVAGTYRYQRLAPHVGEVRMTEAYPGGTSRYTLLLTCLTDQQGQFVFT
ncbi:MAG: hypothetical protein GAK31_00470 [Stenotrophomonas maltophilia]|uniref:Uncharacterized protein n=1 Tax=Stenotrophomonas maltophilia TaxID=40324 RepID=A0A7V8FJI7_STEMA|nr:MAG: hypothetical protein GAK31_00470 [Stenotrophomonas maltophilia]